MQPNLLRAHATSPARADHSWLPPVTPTPTRRPAGACRRSPPPSPAAHLLSPTPPSPPVDTLRGKSLLPHSPAARGLTTPPPPPHTSPPSPPPPPSARLFSTLICSDRLEIARSLLSHIDRGLPPKVTHYAGLVRAYCDHDAVESAIKMLDLLVARGSVPNVFFCGSLIHGGGGRRLRGGEAGAGKRPESGRGCVEHSGHRFLEGRGEGKGGGDGGGDGRGRDHGLLHDDRPGNSARCDRILNFDWRVEKGMENVGIQCSVGEDGGDGDFAGRRLLSDSPSIVLEEREERDGQSCDRSSWGDAV